MSDTPQGPGWWLASDGKYYPPEQAAPPQPPPRSPAPQPGPASPLVAPPPAAQPAKKGGRGCIYALIAVAAVIALGGIGIVLAVAFLGGKAANKIEDAATQKQCSFVSDAEASSVLGDNVQAVQMSGFYAFLRVTVDTRVLSDAPDCVVITSSDAAVARVARYQGSDAGSTFDHEKDLADGTSQDRGNGLSIESESYISDQPVDVGDEGFCTTSSILASAGALVRQGDTLVYVSIQPDFTSGETTPGLDLENGGLSTDSDNCTKAQQLAQKVLG
jgi:hypothetical protein